VWDVETGKPLTDIKSGEKYRRGSTCFLVTLDWKTLYVSHKLTFPTKIEKDGKQTMHWEFDTDLQVWDLVTGELRETIQPMPPRGIDWMILSPDGSTIFAYEELPSEHEVVQAGGRITRRGASVFDVKTKEFRRLDTSFSGNVAFSPDSQTLAVGDEGDAEFSTEIRFLDMATGEIQRALPIPEEFAVIGDMRFSPDGGLFVSSYLIYPEGDRSADPSFRLKFYDANSGRELASFPRDADVPVLAQHIFSSDGRMLAATNWMRSDCKLFLFDVTRRKLASTTLLLTEKAHAYAPAFSPDGNWIAVITRAIPDNLQALERMPEDFLQPRVHLLDAVTGLVRETMILPEAPTYIMCFSPDGKTLATGGNGRVDLWDMEPPPGAAETANLKDINDDMVLISGGRFTVGLTRDQQQTLARELHANPNLLQWLAAREVELKPFYLDKYEVTNRQYRAFIDASGHRRPIAWRDAGFPKGKEDLPITGIDFHDAQAYCRWAGKRLPTDTEWETAACGKPHQLWPWGDRWDKAACKMDDAGKGPMKSSAARVGSFPRDQSPFGVMDMAGNVSEWVEGKVEEAYAYTAMTRGGNFTLSEPHRFLGSMWVSQPQGNGSIDYVGFRCARDADKNGAPGAREASSKEAHDQPSRESAEADSDTAAAKLDLALYRSKPIKILPVTNLDPKGEYQHQSLVHLPQKRTDVDHPETLHAWRIEFDVPYLPGDRFSALFEMYWNMPLTLVSREFGDDRTSISLVGQKPDAATISIKIQGGLDYVDLNYRIKNEGQHEMPSATETCFVSLAAPNFRDHEGTRTFVSTSEGFKPIAEVRRPMIPRWLIGDFVFGPDAAARPPSEPKVTGPLIAIVSRDAEWLVAPVSMSGRPARLVNNREYSCIHSNPPSRVKPGEELEVRERIYFLHGSLADLAARWKADAAKYAQ